jgi:uncharacterized alkaline shock family protein YloU
LLQHELANGSLEISDSIIEQFVLRALTKVEGLNKQENFVTGIRNWVVSGKQVGILSVSPLKIQVIVQVQYGYVLPVVAEEIQLAIKNEVIEWTGEEVETVNVKIVGLINERQE